MPEPNPIDEYIIWLRKIINDMSISPDILGNKVLLKNSI